MIQLNITFFDEKSELSYVCNPEVYTTIKLLYLPCH